MIWSTEWVRSSRGFMRANMNRLVAAHHEHADVLHVRMRAQNFARPRGCDAATQSNETSCGPSVPANMKPLSWLGMKPVGMVVNR